MSAIFSFLSDFSCRPDHDRGAQHTSESDSRKHFLVRGFRGNGHAYASIHAYAPDDSNIFYNGGKYEEGGCKIYFELECRPLVSGS